MAGQEITSPQSARKKRARTGCLRCRARRRKCDERKPCCQRCLDAGAECIYGPRISFLEKNAVTAPNVTPPDAKYDDSRNYSQIQFVDGEHTRPKDGAPSKNSRRLISSPPCPEGENTFVCDSSPLRSDLEATTTSTRINEPPNFCSGSDNTYHGDETTIRKSLGSQITNDISLHHHGDGHQGQNMMRQGDGFEIALGVLMTLGAGDHRADTSSHVNPNTGDSEGDNSFSPPSNGKRTGNFGPVKPHVALQLSTGRSVELLRHYRYEIAPWLDICDAKQTFGLVVPHLAMRSELSFDALLDVCSASYDIHHGYMDSNKYPVVTRTSDVAYTNKSHIEQCQPWEVNLWSILTATKKFLADPPESWEDALSKTSLLHETFLENSSLNDLNVRMVWLLARLGTAASLLKESSPFVNSNILRTLLQISSREVSDVGHSEHYAYEALVLCVEALEFSFGDPYVTSRLDIEPTKTPAFRWKSIFNKLKDWYTDRPPIFHPVIELNDGKTPFSITYFTNGMATFANQLYHTAMMLILAHKPRTVQLEQRRTPFLSQLWHTQRICSIAISNNRCECWDPCLLASFYVAARQMTHESQQRAVLHGFENIGTLGWLVNSFINQLKQEWNAPESPTIY